MLAAAARQSCGLLRTSAGQQLVKLSAASQIRKCLKYGFQSEIYVYNYLTSCICMQETIVETILRQIRSTYPACHILMPIVLVYDYITYRSAHNAAIFSNVLVF